MAALWTGVGAIVLSLCCGVGILAGPVAIVLGVKARGEIRARGEQGGTGMATAGIVTGVVAIVLSIALVALIVLAFASGNTSYNMRPDPGLTGSATGEPLLVRHAVVTGRTHGEHATGARTSRPSRSPRPLVPTGASAGGDALQPGRSRPRRSGSW